MSSCKEAEMGATPSRQTIRRRAAVAAAGCLAVVAALGVASAGAVVTKLPQGSEPVTLNPAEFTTQITNPYFPARPGQRWVYRETDAEGARQRVVVTVTDRTKLIANGVLARVVRDVVTENGKFVEVTDDWYAQDSAGNVWYLGEDTTAYNGKGKPVSKEGSFEAGVDGAQAGVIMPGAPAPGLAYREEYYAGHAEDKAKIISLNKRVEVPFGRFGHVLKTRNLNPLEPKLVEVKFYARGIGLVEARDIRGSSDHEELIKFRRG
ncbi:MAG: hypothetical protein M3M99_03220 [Actinomycetota bacterium]|nr:hypothetical protein [Actinomycetota bacterium]